MSTRLTFVRESAAALALIVGVSFAPVGMSAELEEVTVTAQKRDENLQDVPVSVTALSGDAIESMGFQSTLEVLTQVPNVSADLGSYYGDVTIRGNATLNPTLVGEGNVALYFDDVYRPTAYYHGNEMLDVERVEVLRGPQGTLFGRNAMAGLIHFISRRPTPIFEGHASFEFGSFGTRIVDTAFSGPLTDRVRGRLAFKYHEDDGFQKNLGPAGGRLAVTDRMVGRGQLDIDISDDGNLLVLIEASDADDIGKGFHYWGLLDPVTLLQCEPARVHAGECVGGGAYFGQPTFSDPDLDPTKVYTELDPPNGENRYTLETLTTIARLNWQLANDFEFVSITAFDHHDRKFNPDEDASVLGVFAGLFSFNDIYSSKADQITQEFRLSGGSDGRNWVAGLFYFDEDRESTSTVIDFETVQSPDTIASLDTESWAAFGQLDFPLSETVNAIAGLRYTRDEKKTDVVTAGIAGSQNLDSENYSGKLGLEWQPQDRLMAYVSVSTGYRSGNFNTDLLFGDIDALTAVDPEEVTSYEIGMKSTLLQGRARANVAFFFQDVTDKQGIVFDNVSAAPVGRLISLGDAKIIGGELELLVAPVESLEFSLGAGWLDTEINAPRNFVITANFGAGANAFLGDQFVLDGSTLGTSAPEWTVNSSLRYQFHLGTAGKATLQADYNWRAKTNGLGGNPISLNDSRSLVNFRVGWSSPSERWAVEGYVDNLFDEKYIDNVSALSGVDYAYGNMGMPRWYGVTLRLRL